MAGEVLSARVRIDTGRGRGGMIRVGGNSDCNTAVQ